jgi:hypothetical protein
VVYNAGFEGGKIQGLADTYPALSDELLAIKERFFDLLPLARNHYYHPEMKGSWSIKAVLPTIDPELNYSNLEISNGGMAQDAYKRAVHAQTNKEQKEAIKQAMLEYCKQDTLAMVKIMQAWGANRAK